MLESKELELLDGLPAEPFVIDGGAGHGEWTAEVLKRRPTACVYAFDPHPKHAEILRERFARTGVHVFQKALSNHNGRAEFFIDLEPQNRDFGSSLYRRDHHLGTIEVPTVRLEHMESLPVDLLKLDVEGGELDALAGMGGFRPAVIQFEYSIHTWGDAKAQLEHAVMLLEGYGYRFDSVPEVACQYTNVVARRVVANV